MGPYLHPEATAGTFLCHWFASSPLFSLPDAIPPFVKSQSAKSGPSRSCVIGARLAYTTEGSALSTDEALHRFGESIEKAIVLGYCQCLSLKMCPFHKISKWKQQQSEAQWGAFEIHPPAAMQESGEALPARARRTRNGTTASASTCRRSAHPTFMVLI